MRMKQLILSILLILLSYIIFTGVLAQMNHKLTYLTMEEFLSGPKENDVTLLFRTAGFALDKQENIFILDAGNYRVLKFASDGRFVSSFGRKGQGPGEFTTAHWITIDPENNVYIAQWNKLIVFNNDGKYINDITLCPSFHQFPFPIYFTAKNQVVTYIRDASDIELRKSKNRTEVMRRHFIATYKLENGECIYLSNILESPLRSFESFFSNPVINSDNKIYYATRDQEEYKIFKYSLEGFLLKTLSKNYRPVKFSKEKKENMEKSRKMINKNLEKMIAKITESKEENFMDLKQESGSKYYNSINFLLIDSHDYLWVFTNEGRGDSLVSIDLFNPNDQLVKTLFIKNKYLFNIKIDKIKISGKYLYAIITNEDGEEKFVRFRLPDYIWN